MAMVGVLSEGGDQLKDNNLEEDGGDFGLRADGKKWLHSTHRWMVEPIGIADGPGVGHDQEKSSMMLECLP